MQLCRGEGGGGREGGKEGEAWNAYPALTSSDPQNWHLFYDNILYHYPNDINKQGHTLYTCTCVYSGGSWNTSRTRTSMAQHLVEHVSTGVALYLEKHWPKSGFGEFHYQLSEGLHNALLHLPHLS